MDTKKIYRICDANLNRAKEGLRVVEDYLRFYLQDESLVQDIRQIRHELGRLLDVKIYLGILKERDVFEDCGMQMTESNRKDLKKVIMANIKRAQEALRVLEEYAKIIFQDKVVNLKNLRYKTYNLEKEIFSLDQ